MNMKRTFYRRSVVLVLLGLAACGMQTVQNESLDTAETQSFDASYRDVVQAARDGITTAGFDITQAEEKDTGFVLLFVRPASYGQFGAVGRLVVDRSDAPPTAVHVNYERRVLIYGAGQERAARRIFKRMQETLRDKGVSPKS
ncbi:MAG TPA: hypothetical protein VGP50_05340 [Stellaceae bacterium]|jgi:hypothetical protein|nr:hypothetical protein [Stellaceae bacterium]